MPQPQNKSLAPAHRRQVKKLGSLRWARSTLPNHGCHLKEAERRILVLLICPSPKVRTCAVDSLHSPPLVMGSSNRTDFSEGRAPHHGGCGGPGWGLGWNSGRTSPLGCYFNSEPQFQTLYKGSNRGGGV